MESYRVLFSGERHARFEKLPLDAHLRKIGLSEPAIQRAAAGNALVLKKSLSLDQAEH